MGRLFVEEPCDEALIPVDCRLCSEVIEFDLLEPPAPSSSFISDTLTSEKVCQITAIIILSKVLKVLKLSDDISDTLTSKIGTYVLCKVFFKDISYANNCELRRIFGSHARTSHLSFFGPHAHRTFQFSGHTHIAHVCVLPKSNSHPHPHVFSKKVIFFLANFALF